MKASFLDILYPRQCLECGRADPEAFRYICWDCWSDALKVEPPFCHLCGDPVAGTVEHQFVCYACSDKKPLFLKAENNTKELNEAYHDL